MCLTATLGTAEEESGSMTPVGREAPEEGPAWAWGTGPKSGLRTAG